MCLSAVCMSSVEKWSGLFHNFLNLPFLELLLCGYFVGMIFRFSSFFSPVFLLSFPLPHFSSRLPCLPPPSCPAPPFFSPFGRTVVTYGIWFSFCPLGSCGMELQRVQGFLIILEIFLQFHNIPLKI